MDTKTAKVYGPRDVQIRCDMGHALYMAGDYDQAILTFESALKIDQDSVEALSGKGNALRMKDQDDEAIIFLEKALTINPNHAFSLARKADILWRKCQSDQAMALLNKALELDPKHRFAFTSKGMFLRTQGQYEEAFLLFDAALKIEPLDFSTLICKGETLRERKNYDAAIDCFNAALKVKPNDPWTLDKKYLALKDKGYCLACNGKNDEALDYLEKALEIKPNDLLVLSYMAAALQQKEENDKAITLCDQILSIDSINILAWKVKGAAWGHKGNYNQAIECFDRALEIDFKDDNALCNKGWALSNKGEYAEAMECFNTALKGKPDDSWTLEKKSFALKNVRYPTPFKQLIDAYNQYFWYSSKKVACAAMVAAASDIKKSVTEQLCSILQNLFDLKFLEAKYVKSESGDISLLPERDSAEEVLLQNLLDVWRAIKNKKIGDQLSVIECLNDLYIKAYYQEGWFSEDGWLPIEKVDAYRITELLVEIYVMLQIVSEQKKPSLLIQSQFEDFLLLLLKIEVGFAKDHQQQSVQKRFLFNNDHSDLKRLMEATLDKLWRNVFNGDMWSFKRFIRELEEKEKDQFYMLHQKQLGRKYLGTYCSILPQVLRELSSFIKVDLAGLQPRKPRKARKPCPLPPGAVVVTAVKAPSSPSAANPQKNILLNRIGLSDDDSKVVGDILVTRKEIEPNFDNLNSYYSGDFINLLLYSLKQSDSENIAVCPATTLEEYTKYFEDAGIGAQKRRYVFIPLHVFFDSESPKDRNHWAAFILDKEKQTIFYLDPAIKSTPPAVEAFRKKLGYKNHIITNAIDFQEAEKARDQSIRHCGVYVVEIFRAFAACARNNRTIVDTEKPIKHSDKQSMSLRNAMSTINYGLEEAAGHRKNHIEQVNKFLQTLPETTQTNPTIPESNPDAPKPSDILLVPELEDKSQKSMSAFYETLAGKLEARRATSEVMSSGIICYTEKGNWAKIKKFGWLLLKSAPIAGKVMKYGHIGCQMVGEVAGNFIEGTPWKIEDAPWIEPVTEYLEYVKSGSKAGHSAIDFFHGQWESFKAKSDEIDGYFRKWIDGSEVDTKQEYEQFRKLFCTDAGKDALNRFVHSLIDRYFRQLILLDEKDGAKQLAEAIDEHLGRLFLLNFEKWNLPQWGAPKHVMILEIMRQWVTYMGFLKKDMVKLASGETTTAQALLQHCGVYLEGDQRPIEIDVIIDWDAGTNSHFISNSSRYGHRKAEGLLAEELKGHLQNGDELLQAYQKQFVGQKTAEELAMLKELGHVMGIQFDHRTLRAFRDVKEINSCEKETWKSLAERTQANEEKLGHMTETVGELKEDLGALKGKMDSLQEKRNQSEVSSGNMPKARNPAVNQKEPAAATMGVPKGFVRQETYDQDMIFMKNELKAAKEEASDAKLAAARLEQELQKVKEENITLQESIAALREDFTNLCGKFAELEQNQMNNAVLPLPPQVALNPPFVKVEHAEEKVVDDMTGDEDKPINDFPIETETAPSQNSPEETIEQAAGDNFFSSVLSQPDDLQNGQSLVQNIDSKSPEQMPPENTNLEL